jgi:hypothetical protein
MSPASVAYLNASFVVTIICGWQAGIGAALAALGASLLSMIAGVRLKQVIYKTAQGAVQKDMKAGTIISAVLALGIAYWLSRYFAIRIAGYAVDGVIWGAFGAAVCFVFTPRPNG